MCQWKLSYQRYEEIKQLVLEMYEETGIDTYPMDCFEIARRLKYVLRPYSKLNFSDYLWATEKSNEGFSRVEFNEATGMYEYVIFYNDEGHTTGNIRWTIFHEIGHIYLGHHDNSMGDEENEEHEADFFAKYAIAPPPLVYASHCECPMDVFKLFNTSSEVSGYAFAYYQTWLYNGPRIFLNYEIALLKLFHFGVAA